MGEVYLAHDTKLDRKVALKMLREELAVDDERMRRFVQEAKAASALNHPNIITIYEIGEARNKHFIASEYIDGETLHSRLSRKPMGCSTTKVSPQKLCNNSGCSVMRSSMKSTLVEFEQAQNRSLVEPI